MSAFIASGGSQAPHPISNDGWFPDLDGQHMRESLRLDGSITDARLETAAVNAVIEVNRELHSWKYRQMAAGYADLASVPADKIQGESQLLHLYRRAIYCSAGAELAERMRDYSATGEGAERAEALTPTTDADPREARWAVR
ncbi:head completion/stabilization protein, partial [Stutzerimonas nitrititolerans]|uniref:head completion/stabilization protein n=1 Tax=Stutzerimonas nitrititolerans TaxID=2482751 RepID=UPI003AA91530